MVVQLKHKVKGKRYFKMDNIHAKLVMASMLLDRANKAFEKVDGNTFELNKADYNDSLRMARRLINECYVDD